MGHNHDVARASVNGGEVVIYEQRGRVRLEVRLEGETLWLTLAQMADLFGRDKSVVSRHLSNIFKGKELSRRSVVAENATTAANGKTYQVEYYNLDAILSVGYRVNSKRGPQFRIWATRTLRDHVLEGCTLNERRLREKGLGGGPVTTASFSRDQARSNDIEALAGTATALAVASGTVYLVGRPRVKGIQKGTRLSAD